jgi:carboxypeptidase family protein
MSHQPLVLLVLFAQFALSQTGELRLRVVDAAGQPLTAAIIELVSEAKQVRQRVSTNSDGTAVVPQLPFGTYALTVSQNGFAPQLDRIEIRSALPAFYIATRGVAPITETIEVKAGTTLLDERQTTTEQRLGADTLQHRTSTLPGRALPELVNTQPGWPLEANGILHPRGSEHHRRIQDCDQTIARSATADRCPQHHQPSDRDQLRRTFFRYGAWTATKRRAARAHRLLRRAV